MFMLEMWTHPLAFGVEALKFFFSRSKIEAFRIKIFILLIDLPMIALVWTFYNNPIKRKKIDMYEPVSKCSISKSPLICSRSRKAIRLRRINHKNTWSISRIKI